MFLNDDDFRVVIGDAALKAVSQMSQQIRVAAQMQAIEEVSSYLRPIYDVGEVFAARGAERNGLIVMYTADIALYHMVAAMPQKLGSEIRKERYDRAIRWLEGVQAGRVVPDLPMARQADGAEVVAGTSFSADPKLRHIW